VVRIQWKTRPRADAAKTAAQFKEGVLKVHLPKSPAAKPKTIEVKVQ
jgi:HSP20 family protein